MVYVLLVFKKNHGRHILTNLIKNGVLQFNNLEILVLYDPKFSKSWLENYKEIPNFTNN